MRKSFKAIQFMLVGLLIISSFFSAGLAGAAENKQTIPNQEDGFELISQTDDFMSYIVENEDGTLHLFEEFTEQVEDKTIITTEIFEIQNAEDTNKRSIEKFQTVVSTDTQGNVEISEGYNADGNGDSNISDGVLFLEEDDVFFKI